MHVALRLVPACLLLLLGVCLPPRPTEAAPQDLHSLALDAVGEDPARAEPAIAALRRAGPPGSALTA